MPEEEEPQKRPTIAYARSPSDGKLMAFQVSDTNIGFGEAIEAVKASHPGVARVLVLVGDA
ncbi:hypothetical protein H4CHR_02879 [Variovorax sp. PBS-H4]|uniref:hypothetical protein n=1 Tax=Variovorax sp. PBS-H4 TaxID=434008 RepID=UPI0013185E6C|nr:hypothetical protein [Variovorax sp. PBS-H4]VTU31789.1 hypothetical protein H4CHR_02879 [Variovorax sp. PBS-H4]